MQNPLIAAAEEKDNKETRTLQANGGLTFKIIKGLTFRNNTGMRYQLYRRELFYGDQSIMGRRNGIYGSIRNTETGSFQTSNVLTYDKRFQKKHKVVVQLGEFVNKVGYPVLVRPSYVLSGAGLVYSNPVSVGCLPMSSFWEI
mgnify:CR=1 FL=1